MRPVKIVTILKDLADSLPGTLTRQGAELSNRDSETVREVYQQWILLLLDLGYLAPLTFKRDATRLLVDLFQQDVYHVNNVMSELSHCVRTQEITRFKALCKQVSVHLYPLIKGDVQGLVAGDVIAAKRLLQAFAYTSRLSLVDIDLEDQCLASYMEVEDTMDDWLPSGITISLNNIIKRWFSGISFEEMVQSHGPGGVAGHGRTSIETKYRDLTSDSLLSYAFPGIVDDPFFRPGIRSSMDRISQTIFVPKSYKTFRTISMESSTTQYFQQGVWKCIDAHVQRSHYLRSRIGFHEQERNQQLAREGSFARNYATIDLSAASDSVSYELVKNVFRGTKLLRYIVATRSPRTLLPNGKLINLKKFAPMGSSLCFPIETIIFASICQFVTREHGVTGDFSVFGDDIIVPTQCVEDVNYILDVLGFKVNHSKSFTDPNCWFRESCGGEYFDGYDATPMLLSRKYTSEFVNPGGLRSKTKEQVGLTALGDLANSAHRKGFKHLRSFFINQMRIKYRRVGKLPFIPLFAPTAIRSDNYSNYHTTRRWNFDLQKIEAYCTTVRSSTSRGNEELAYYHWLSKTQYRDDIGDGFSSNIGKTSVQFSNRYVEKPFEEIDYPFIEFFADQVPRIAED